MSGGGVNKAIIVGNLGQDPVLKNVNGKAVCEFSLATNESWESKDGQKHEKVEWHSVVFWEKPAEIIAKFAHKGDRLYVEGKIETRTWEKDGQKHYKTEIRGREFQFLGGSKDSGRNDSGSSGGRQGGPGGAPDDDVPY